MRSGARSSCSRRVQSARVRARRCSARHRWADSGRNVSSAAARPEWQVAAGSVRGTRHRHAERNNQDACFWDAHGEVLAVCVADGCSASAHSEAGALLGVRSAVRHMLRVVAELPCATAQTIVAETCTRIGSDIDRLAEMVGRSPEAVYAHLLFTLVGAIVTGERALVWALGDGVVIVNGDVTVLE